MTDAPRRRTNDKEAADLYPKLEEAMEGIARIDQTLLVEMAKAERIHASLAPVDHVHQQLEDNVNQIIDVLEGPSIAQPFGQPSTRNDGLVDAVAHLTTQVGTANTNIAAIQTQLGNGGIKVRLPWAVWVAIIGALGGLVIALVETFGSRTPG